MYYDGPRLFTATDDDDKLYFVHNVDEHEGPKVDGKYTGQDDFLAVPISEERLQLFRDNKLDMYDVFRNAEGGEGIYIRVKWPGGGDTAEEVVLSELAEDLFCKPGVFYKP